MRVKELADLAGTTVRTVRYYHQIGLLPVPGVRDGCRDYDLTHVARVIRVRWLTEAGISLARVARILRADAAEQVPGQDREAVLADLNGTLVALEEQLEQVRERRERVRSLISTVEQQDQLSPLPGAVARYYDSIERRAREEKARRAIRRERDFIELAFYRGEMPPGVEALYECFDEASMAESAVAFAETADQHEGGRPHGDEEIARIASAVVDRLNRHLGGDLPGLARSLDLDLARRTADLYVRISADGNRRLNRVIADTLLAALEEARSQ